MVTGVDGLGITQHPLTAGPHDNSRNQQQREQRDVKSCCYDEPHPGCLVVQTSSILIVVKEVVVQCIAVVLRQEGEASGEEDVDVNLEPDEDEAEGHEAQTPKSQEGQDYCTDQEHHQANYNHDNKDVNPEGRTQPAAQDPCHIQHRESARTQQEGNVTGSRLKTRIQEIVTATKHTVNLVGVKVFESEAVEFETSLETGVVTKHHDLEIENWQEKGQVQNTDTHCQRESNKSEESQQRETYAVEGSSAGEGDPLTAVRLTTRGLHCGSHLNIHLTGSDHPHCVLSDLLRASLGHCCHDNVVVIASSRVTRVRVCVLCVSRYKVTSGLSDGTSGAVAPTSGLRCVSHQRMRVENDLRRVLRVSVHLRAVVHLTSGLTRAARSRVPPEAKILLSIS